MRKRLYFRGFVAQFGRKMTRRFLNYIFAFAILPALAISTQADAEDLIKSAILENDVAYLRVNHVTKDLADEIQSAQSTLAATNKTAGTVLDLRFADGDNLASAKATADFFAAGKLPLVILVNDDTQGAAAKLAADLREARAGLIFGNSTEVKPDIAVAVKIADEKKFLEDPYVSLTPGETNSTATTNEFLPFVDHTSEADLVRQKIKDGESDENSAPPHGAEPQKPVIRDPVLARAVDLIKGLAIVRQSHL
jgi:hypothetical protein